MASTLARRTFHRPKNGRRLAQSIWRVLTTKTFKLALCGHARKHAGLLASRGQHFLLNTGTLCVLGLSRKTGGTDLVGLFTVMIEQGRWPEH
jgi:hypothetical protein